MGVDYYHCDLCEDCVHCRMYECEEKCHSICRYCVSDDGLELQVHYYDDAKKELVYEDYNEDEHADFDEILVKDCSLCKSEKNKSLTIKDKIDEIVGKHCKRNKQKLCKELYDLLSLN